MLTIEQERMFLICGDREWANASAIERELLAASKRFGLPCKITVIHGGCRGADLLAGEVAVRMGIEVIEIRADWKRFGRAAGPIRNKTMLNLGPDEVWAFHADLTRSKGTANMVRQAEKAGVKTKVVER